MNWTTEQPTEPGFYWVRVPMESGETPPFVIGISLIANVLFSHTLGEKGDWPDGAKWFGPLAPPSIADWKCIDNGDGTETLVNNRCAEDEGIN